MIYKVIDTDTFEQYFSGTSLDAALLIWQGLDGDNVFVMYWDREVSGWLTFGEYTEYGTNSKTEQAYAEFENQVDQGSGEGFGTEWVAYWYEHWTAKGLTAKQLGNILLDYAGYPQEAT